MRLSGVTDTYKRDCLTYSQEIVPAAVFFELCTSPAVTTATTPTLNCIEVGETDMQRSIRGAHTNT